MKLHLRLDKVLLPALVVGLMLAGGCRKNDIRTVVIDVPGMRGEACAKIIVNAVSRQAGVQPDKTRTDLDKRQVSVTYDSIVTAVRNIEFSIAEVGFSARWVESRYPEPVPANPQARAALPAECRGDGEA